MAMMFFIAFLFLSFSVNFEEIRPAGTVPAYSSQFLRAILQKKKRIATLFRGNAKFLLEVIEVF